MKRRSARPRASTGTVVQRSAVQRGKPDAAVRLEWADAVHPQWLTLADAQALLAELTAAVREAERAAITGRSPPEPPTAIAAALPKAA